jgi:hypothetical protein
VYLPPLRPPPPPPLTPMLQASVRVHEVLHGVKRVKHLFICSCYYIYYYYYYYYYYYFLQQFGFHPVAAALHQYRHHNTITHI